MSTMPTKDLYSPENQRNARHTKGMYEKIMRGLTKCPFCDLKAKYFVAEGDHCVLTANLFPYIDGHLLILPKRHVEKSENLNAEEWQETHKFFALAKRRLRKELGVDSFVFLCREGEESDSSLGHTHFHVIPMGEHRVIQKSAVELKYTPIEVIKKLRKAGRVWKVSRANGKN